MSTEIDREQAKAAITARDKADPELNDALRAGHEFQLGLAKENNRHKEEMRGMFGKVFGHSDNFPSFIAAAGMIAGVLTGVACLFGAHSDHQNLPFWGQQSERAFTFAGTCLAFIFGKGFSKD